MERIPLQERIRGFQDFFAGTLDDGPLVGFFWEEYYPWRRYRASSRVPSGPFGPQDLDPESFLPDYERLYKEYEEGGGDFIWTGAAFWGVPWMEAIVGCPVVADHSTGSARSEKPRERVSPENPPPLGDPLAWITKAQEFLTVLARLSGGRFPLGTTLMRGLSDVLAALYGNPDFVFEIADRPGDVEIVMSRITDLWIQFARAQLDLVPDFHGGVGSYFYNMWLPERGCFLQEDAAALLSPDLFARFVLPGLQRIIGAFPITVIHLHPSSYIPVEHLVDTDVSAIELHIDLGGPSAEDLAPVYRRIQAKKPLVIWGDLTDADVAWIGDHLDTSALAVKVVVRDRDHAERVWAQLKG